jgi:hypothetical protein
VITAACQQANVNKQRELEIADSVTAFIKNGGNPDSAKTKRIEALKKELKELEEDQVVTQTANEDDLKSIAFDYDYDQKLFNKKSDIDGNIYNRSETTTFKNFTFKITGKNKKGNVTKTFNYTLSKTLKPRASSKFTIRFVDAEKTVEAKMMLLSCEKE